MNLEKIFLESELDIYYDFIVNNCAEISIIKKKKQFYIRYL